MAITPISVPRTEYRRGDRDILCAAEPGQITIGVVILKSQVEVDEFVDALRQAAIKAELPQKR